MATEPGRREEARSSALSTVPDHETLERRNFEAVHAAGEQALRRGTEHARQVVIGGAGVSLRFAGQDLADRFLPALASAASRTGPTVLEVVVWDSALSDVPFPRIELGAPQPAARRGGDRPVEKVYQRGVQTFTAIDHSSARAVVWVPDARAVTTNEIACPLRMLIHLWGRRRGLHLVHGGAVGTGEGGVLIAGRSGIGKSTVALACLGSGLGYAGDDYVLVETSPAPFAHAVYNSGKLQPDQLPRFGHLESTWINPEAEDKPVFLFGDHDDWLAAGFPLRAVVVPRITGADVPSLVAASPATAVANIAPSTVFQLPYSGLSTMEVAATLARRIPTFHLDVGPRIELVPRLLLDWLGGGRG